MQNRFCLRVISTGFCLLLSYCFFAYSLQGQSKIWKELSKKILPQELAKQFESYQLFQLNSARFLEKGNELEGANNPLMGEQSNSTPVVFKIPTPDGKLTSFNAVRSSILQKGLAEKYPFYQFFKIAAKGNLYLQGRMSWTAKGLYVHLMEDGHSTFLEPIFIDGLTDIYILYAGEDQHIERTQDKICGNSLFESKSKQLPIFNEKLVNNSDLKTFRLAVTATESFTNQTGGTIEKTFSAIINSVTSLNVIYERDLSIRFLLHEKTDSLIFTDENPSPFSDSEGAYALWEEHSFVLDSIIGVESYDIGHVFGGDCTGGVSGIAYLAGVCSESKANGVSCVFNENIAEFRRTLYHEVGHQLGANHTWSNCGEGANDSQRNPATAVEPGSGSTIMSYGGVCGPYNIVNNSQDNLHGISILEIKETLARDSISCFASSPLENSAPLVSVKLDSFFIPILTPFELEAFVFDAENTNLTYSWEQLDTGAISDVGFPIGDSPSFRAYSPSKNPVRVFPRITDIILNRMSTSEVLPDTSRSLQFGLTVRDNNETGGSTGFGNIHFYATVDAGPFLVKFPDSAGIEIEKTDSMEVQWEVANTDQAPVNCADVDVYLSFNNGQEFTHLLAAQVPNTGYTKVVLPDTTTNRARIKIKCSDNIFFDMSNNLFKIKDKILSSTTEDLYNQPVGLYPNPATENIFITLPDAIHKKIRLAIFDTLGRKVKTEQIILKNGRFSVSVNELNTGVYFVKGEVGTQIFSKIFIIQR